jgi:UDP-2,4-diacetamido-2,4,6-trideoxy-beta-L-altropyranose hydrolase
MSNLLFIRADASPQIGTGHVMRCRALAEVWKQGGGKVAFIMANPPPLMRTRLQRLGINLFSPSAAPGSAEDASKTARIAREAGSAWVVVDGYQFGTAYQKQLKDDMLNVLAVDDYGHAKQYLADIILNQNLSASPSLYEQRPTSTRLLLGPHYVLLRREFLVWRSWKRTISATAKSILVTLGGSDPSKFTLKVIQALRQLPAKDYVVTIVAGGSNPHLAEIESAARTSPLPMSVITDANNMPELMAEADLAVSASGITGWELAFMGVPALLVALAENQKPNAQHLNDAGAARSLGWHEGISSEQLIRETTAVAASAETRAEMSRRGRALIDGYGSFRVWLHMNERNFRLRAAAEADAKQLFDWANEKEVRDMSFSPEPILWEDHVRWLKGKIGSAQCRLWLASDPARKPAGQVRFDIQGAEAVISISLAQAFRGRNLGGLLIWLACRKLFAESKVENILAYVKPDNEPSAKAFRKSGFKDKGAVQLKNQPALLFELRKTDTVD